MLEYGSDSVWPQNNGGHVFKMKQRSTEGDMCRADTAEYCIQHQEQHMIVVLWNKKRNVLIKRQIVHVPR